MKSSPALRKFVDLLRPGAVISFAGAASRTRYEDIPEIEAYVCAVLEAGGVVRSGARPPFDSHVENIACREGYDVEIYGPSPLALEQRLQWVRPVELLDDATCFVVFPREGEDVLSEDSLVELAILTAVPVLAVYRAKTRWITEDTYVFA
jgi:hypothetical protein